MPRYRQRRTGQDAETRPAGASDFLNVENRRREHFPEEFAEGPYGAPVMEEDAPAGPVLTGEVAPGSGFRRPEDRGAPRPT